MNEKGKGGKKMDLKAQWNISSKEKSLFFISKIILKFPFTHTHTHII
jgi:hypothetical protein